MDPVSIIGKEGLAKSACQVISVITLDMYGISQVPFCNELLQGQGVSFEIVPVVDGHLSTDVLEAIDQASPICRVQGERLFEKNMATCLSRLPCQRQVRVRRSGNMNYVEPMLGKHAIEIRIPVRNGIAKRELLGQDGLEIAHRQHAGTAELLNFLDVAVSDFPAANYANIQRHFVSLPACTLSIWRVYAVTTGSRRWRMASIARYICQAETK